MRNTYCRSIGVQFMHMDDLKVRQWLQERMEGTENRCTLSRKEQLRILNGLTSATVFEEFIQRRFLGAKSFSLEGAETLIPLLEMSIRTRRRAQSSEVVLAMAHRGRLNVLVNVMGKKRPASVPRICRYRPRVAHRPRRREISSGTFDRYQNFQRPEYSRLALL